MGSAASWECPLALRCAASHPALGPSKCGPACQGPRPRHIRALGTCGSGLRRRRCAGCVAVLITARALCTLVLPSPSLFRRGWPPPGLSPPCVRALGNCRRGLLCVCAPSPSQALSGPWAPEASRGVGVSAPSQPGQSCGRWSPRQMRPVARMRLHLWVRPQLPGQRPRIQLLQNWFPFGSVAACSACTAPGRLIVQVGGLTLPFVPRLCPWTSPCPWTCSCPSEVVRSPWMSWLMGGPWKRS